jgi:hypothetical protein
MIAEASYPRKLTAHLRILRNQWDGGGHTRNSPELSGWPSGPCESVAPCPRRISAAASHRAGAPGRSADGRRPTASVKSRYPGDR